MASTFRPVNSPLTIEVDKHDGAVSPTTPTPTTAAFSQRPLPNSPFPQAVRIPERETSHHTQLSRGSDDMDMDMDSDREVHNSADSPRSDDGSTGDGSKSHKKKKSQRFYCTDYPPCSLSFTRSEHLARHIRKHTGERPFQCHCTRRFSRLDNLRQHAQTVHVNEEIPMDSLAATGTRFQRQIRTDRVRQPGRARAATAGNMAAPVRGHSKSLSTSSISPSPRDDVRRHLPPLSRAEPPFQFAEVYAHAPVHSHPPASPNDFSASTSTMFPVGRAMGAPVRGHSKSFSTSSISPSPREDVRRHPAPLMMPDHRASFSAEMLSEYRAQYPADIYPHARTHRPPSPGDFSTPTTGQNSPCWGPVVPSPTSAHARSHSMYVGPRAPAPARRLSVPSSMLSFQPQHAQNINRPLLQGREPMGGFGGSSPVAPYPSANSAVPSPTASSFAPRESTSSLDERRKTWHVDSRNSGPGGSSSGLSGLSHVITPSQYPSPPQNRVNMPIYHPQPNTRVRLPGIESFDPLPHRPASPMRRNAEPTDRMVHPNVSGFTGFPARELPPPAAAAPRQENSGEREKMIRLHTLVAVAANEENATPAY